MVSLFLNEMYVGRLTVGTGCPLTHTQTLNSTFTKVLGEWLRPPGLPSGSAPPAPPFAGRPPPGGPLSVREPSPVAFDRSLRHFMILLPRFQFTQNIDKYKNNPAGRPPQPPPPPPPPSAGPPPPPAAAPPPPAAPSPPAVAAAQCHAAGDNDSVIVVFPLLLPRA